MSSKNPTIKNNITCPICLKQEDYIYISCTQCHTNICVNCYWECIKYNTTKCSVCRLQFKNDLVGYFSNSFYRMYEFYSDNFINHIIKPNRMYSKERVLLQSLIEFYKNDKYFNKMISIVTNQSKISLRVLDWFVTKYSKKYNITYKIKINTIDIDFNVYQDYINKLKSYNKRLFDPFCRKNKKNLTNIIRLNYHNTKYITTFIGQLNFFKWAIQYKIIDYVFNNLNNINIDMNNGY